MRIAILGATGQTGRQLLTQAAARGHSVLALCRTPSALFGVETAKVDVREAETVRRALHGVDALLSGFGVSAGESPDVLTLAARAVASAGLSNIVWLSSLGTGETKGLGGPVVSAIVRLFLSAELADKAGSDELLRGVQASVVHAGRLTNAPARGATLFSLRDAPRRWLPSSISRADVAAAMLDELESPKFRGATAIAMTRSNR